MFLYTPYGKTLRALFDGESEGCLLKALSIWRRRALPEHLAEAGQASAICWSWESQRHLFRGTGGSIFQALSPSVCP